MSKSPGKTLSLVFLGGIADSGKSALLEDIDLEANGENIKQSERQGANRDETKDIVRVKPISEYFAQALNVAPPLKAAVIYVDWKSKEKEAVDKLYNEVEYWRDHTHVETLIINTHFATYSPGGFMMGLDPQNLRRICKAGRVNPEKKGEQKAGVVLVDIGLSDVLQRREAAWKKPSDEAFSTGVTLLQDLEFNRLYALEYYNTLARALDDRD